MYLGRYISFSLFSSPQFHQANRTVHLGRNVKVEITKDVSVENKVKNWMILKKTLGRMKILW